MKVLFTGCTFSDETLKQLEEIRESAERKIIK